ncbi:glycosyltransferase, partial [Parabacteroides sp. OttesenSCG-928-K15]|nr:glycosyltransferase [Parabacteroides sp. OttesenSCG-928-K15]
MKISIVICTYNKAKWLNSVLMNLNNQTLDRSLFEVCLIIDGSTDSTVEMLKKIHLNYNFKYIEINKAGLTYARNVGIEASKGDYILFCDDDVIYADNFLSELILSIYKSPSSVHIGNIENIS